MYALIINDEVFLFDMLSYYGIHKLDDVNLNGYQILNDFKAILNHYLENYFDSNLLIIEQYCKFLQRICVSYLKDLYL